MADTPPNTPPVAAPGAGSPPAPPASGNPPVPPAAPEAKPNGDWRAPLSDAKLREHAERFPSLDDLVRGNLDQRQKLSGAIVKPGKDAKPEDIAAFRKALDVPEAPDGYQFVRPEHIDEETFKSEGTQALVKSFADFLHKETTVSKTDAAKLFDWYGRFEALTLKSQKEADDRFAQESLTALQKKWPGEEFTKNREHANRALAALSQQAGIDVDALRNIETKAGRFMLDDPNFVQIFAAIGREMGEDSTFGRVMTDGDRQTAEARAKEIHGKIDEAMARNDHDLANKLDQELQDLHRKMGGAKPIVGAMGRAA